MKKEREGDILILQDIVSKATNASVVDSSPIRRGEVNDVYKVVTSDNQTLILRFADRGGDILEHEQWALNQARRVGVPAPLMTHIEHIGEEGQDRSVCIENFIQGTALKDFPIEDIKQKGLLQKIGGVTSSIHTVQTEGFGWLSPEGKGMYQTWSEYLTKVQDKTSKFQDMATRRNFDFKIIQSALDLVIQNQGIYSGTPRLIHRDLSPDHFLIQGSEISGVLDFENCIGGDPVYDLARWEFLFGNDYPTELIKAGYTNQDQIEDRYEERMKTYQAHVAFSLLAYFDSQDTPDDIAVTIDKLTQVLH